MKKSILIVFFFLQHFVIVFSQKPSIDTSMLNKWPSVENPVISNNGKYISYVINKRPVKHDTLVISEVNGPWVRRIILKDRFIDILFTTDNSQLIFKDADSLYFVQLGTNGINIIPNVMSFKYPRFNQGKCLAYQLSNSDRELVLYNLETRKRRVFFSADDYYFDDYGNELLMKKDSSHTLQMVNLKTDSSSIIWSSSNSTCEDYNFDINGIQLVFTIADIKEGHVENSIWYYKRGMNKSEKLIDNKSSGVTSNLQIGGSPVFSKNGRWVFFSLIPVENKRLHLPDATMVNVWSYKDLILQPEQRRLLINGPRSFAAVIGIAERKFLQLEKEDEGMETYPNQVTGDFIVIMDNKSNLEYDWKLSPQPSYYLVSLKDGSRNLIKKEDRSLMCYSFSPNGKYLVYYDCHIGHYFSMDMLSKQIICITRNLPVKVISEYLDAFMEKPIDEIAGWYKNESSLLLYDNYDIWKIDPTGLKSPVNVTNGYGFRNHIKFRVIKDLDFIQDDNFMVYDNNRRLLLTAFNVQNKYNGFYSVRLNNSKDPEQLIMGPYTFFRKESQKSHSYSFDNGMEPIKARYQNIWVVRRESTTEAPNFFTTRDFRNYARLSNLQPQNDVNWIRAELVTWKMFNGQMSQGVLYKPENFDPEKKYPIIFNYYEALSHTLYEFPYPHFTNSNIDIPWFVSNGYLVFRPDIEYKVASKSDTTYGEWAYNSVVSSAEYLAKLPYVDSSRMGIQGHSFGGGETNYIVTHTHLFSAAMEAAGTTDAISSYLSLIPFANSIEHYNPQWKTEYGHSLMGATPWARPDLYRKSSAVLDADRITTPLLIMHNEKDNQIPWRQGVEFYMALRRLGKKVWLLQYDNGNHVVNDKDVIDFTIRLTQFFDHYLKNTPAPLWMTKGIPASEKGVIDGLELDLSNQTP